MTIGIITSNFHRVEILRIFAAGIKRLREDTGMEIPCVVCGDKDGAEICSLYGLTHIEYPNIPLTNKFNRACEELRGKVDAVMVMGSDDLLSSDTFLRIHAEVEKGIDLVGCNDVYFFGMTDQYAGKLLHFPTTKVLGVGRTVSARVLDQVNWRPWNKELPRAIDTCMLDCVRPYVKTSVLLSGGKIFDLKSNLNLNGIEFWSLKLPRIPSDTLWESIGAEETELIKKFLDKQE